LYAINPI